MKQEFQKTGEEKGYNAPLPPTHAPVSTGAEVVSHEILTKAHTPVRKTTLEKASHTRRGFLGLSFGLGVAASTTAAWLVTGDTHEQLRKAAPEVLHSDNAILAARKWLSSVRAISNLSCGIENRPHHINKFQDSSDIFLQNLYLVKKSDRPLTLMAHNVYSKLMTVGVRGLPTWNELLVNLDYGYRMRVGQGFCSPGTFLVRLSERLETIGGFNGSRLKQAILTQRGTNLKFQLGMNEQEFCNLCAAPLLWEYGRATSHAPQASRMRRIQMNVALNFLEEALSIGNAEAAATVYRYITKFTVPAIRNLGNTWESSQYWRDLEEVFGRYGKRLESLPEVRQRAKDLPKEERISPRR